MAGPGSAAELPKCRKVVPVRIARYLVHGPRKFGPARRGNRGSSEGHAGGGLAPHFAVATRISYARVADGRWGIDTGTASAGFRGTHNAARDLRACEPLAAERGLPPGATLRFEIGSAY